VSVGGGNTVHIVSKVRLNLITQEGATVSNCVESDCQDSGVRKGSLLYAYYYVLLTCEQRR
jgi:hypothetical protein